MLGRPRWPIFISTSGTSTNKNFTICFPLSSSNFLLGPIPVVTYSPDFILHTIEGNGNLAIAPWWNASKKCSPSSTHEGQHTLSWMPSTSVRRYPAFHHHEKRS